MPALTSIALGAAGAIGGAIAGGEDETTTTKKYIPPASQQELDLQKKSMESYLQQLNLAQQGEAGIAGGQGVQDASRNSLESILGGQAFNISPEQQAQVQAIRDAAVQSGTGDIQNFVNQNLSNISNSAGVRGLRGQALSELQGRSIGEGARAIGNLSSQANLTAAQQSLDVPYRQASLQGGIANQNANFMERLRQQAIENRQQLQNPVLMQSMQNERLGQATQTSTTPGSVGKAIGGALGGLGSGFSTGAGISKGLSDLGGSDYNSSGGGVKYAMAHGGRVPDQDRKWTPQEVEQFKKGYNAPSGGAVTSALRDLFTFNDDKEKEDNYARGGKVEGTAHFRGDTEANDTVHAKLSPGEIVIPRSFAHDPDLSKAFINYLHKKEKESKKEQS